RGLSAEGFGDDEVHKWLAALRYLHGDLSGDDVEHPMLMKVLIAGFALVGTRMGCAPETITRLPNASAGALSIWIVAQLGRRLFGRGAGLCAAALAAVSATYVGFSGVRAADGARKPVLHGARVPQPGGVRSSWHAAVVLRRVRRREARARDRGVRRPGSLPGSRAAPACAPHRALLASRVVLGAFGVGI